MRPSPPGTGSWTCDALQGYGEHVGPLWSDGEGALALLVEPRHTNITGRIHGGMAMGLVSIALTQAAQAAKPGEALDLLTQQSELIDSAQPGTWLVAETQVLRSTRTMVFVNARLFDGERVLMNAGDELYWRRRDGLRFKGRAKMIFVMPRKTAKMQYAI